ncbi:MAG: hypothetical protein K0R03_440 [Moraxellaceae bacterium]|jgi:hypothetical protein|nr:hypothetical protein [Moraxellaceae bacterium]
MVRVRMLASLCLGLMAAATQALERLDDVALAEVSGQDGVDLSLQTSLVGAASVGWFDGTAAEYNAGTAQGLRYEGVRITPVNTGIPLFTMRQDVSGGALPFLQLETAVNPFRLATSAVRLHSSAAPATSTFGLYAFDTTLPTRLTFANSRGLFDGSNSVGLLTFDMQNANMYLAQPRCLHASCGVLGAGSGGVVPNGTLSVGGAGDYNVLVFDDLTLKGQASGRFTLSTTNGLQFLGTLSLPRISASRGGFQTNLGVLANVDFAGGGSSTFNFADVAGTPANHYRFGFSGDLMNVDLRLVGHPGTGIGTGLGTTGLRLSPRVEFARASEASPFVLELGEPGGSAVRFSNWAALDNGAAAAPGRAWFNLGDIYLNLLAPSTGGLSDFTTPVFNSFTGSAFGATPTPASSAFAMGIRNFELQGGARTIGFYTTDTGVQLGTNQTWALMPTFHDLKANLMAYPSGHPGTVTPAQARHGMGFDLKIETTGKDTAFGTPGTRGTHLIVADTSANKYVGFRNIDSRYAFLGSQLYVVDPSLDYAAGSGLDVAGLRFTSSNMSFDIRADVAIGDLPDGTAARQMRDDDAVAGMRWKFGGDFSFTFSPAPAGQSYIGLSSALNATNPALNGVYIAEPVDGTRIEWINATGRLNLLAQHVQDADYSDASRIDMGMGASSQPGNVQRPFVTFATAYELAPGTAKTEAIRIGQLNLYRPPITHPTFTGAAACGGPCYREGVDWKPGFGLNGTVDGTGGTGRYYTLGEMVISGGRFYGQVDLKVQ